jgi:hypothetical protein
MTVLTSQAVSAPLSFVYIVLFMETYIKKSSQFAAVLFRFNYKIWADAGGRIIEIMHSLG